MATTLFTAQILNCNAIYLSANHVKENLQDIGMVWIRDVRKRENNNDSNLNDFTM